MTVFNQSQNLIDWLEDREQTLQIQQDSGIALPAYRFVQGDDFKQSILTHRELLQRAKALAAQLQQDFSPGDRAILLYPSGLDYIVAFFACIYAGLIAVPAFPPNNRRRDWGRIDAIFNNAAPSLVLTTSALNHDIIDWKNSQSGFTHIPIICSDNIEISERILWHRPQCNFDSVAFLQYSSGSTGTPKGVMVTHDNIRHNLQVITDGFGLKPEDTGVSWLPIYHDMGLIGSILQPFNMGVDIYLISPMDVMQKPLRWLQIISQFKVTGSGGPNFIYQHCINRISEQEKATLDLSHWSLAYNGAEPVSGKTMKQFAEAFASCGFKETAFTPCYGMAETTLMVSSTPRSSNVVVLDSNQVPDNSIESVSSGQVHDDLKVKIVNPNTLQECNDTETGEIWVRGASVAKGYWQMEAETCDTFQAKVRGDDNAWLRTGDLGFLHANPLATSSDSPSDSPPQLFVTGRIKELIIIRGQNHYPQDIEATVAASHPALNGCPGTAFSIDVDGAEQLVVAHEVQRSQMRKLDKARLLADVRKAVSQTHQLQLHALVIIKPASLLRTTSGKIRRVAMKDAYQDGELSEVYHWCRSSHQVEEPNPAQPAAAVVEPELTESGTTGSIVTEPELQNMMTWLRSYAEKHINSRLIDERRSIPPHIVLDMGNQGLMGLHVAKEDGGAGYSFQQALRVYQQLGAIDPSLALFVGLGNVLGIRPLQKFASASIKQKYLKPMAEGRRLAAFAITEPGAGSNPLSMQTTARQDDNGNFVLSGEKIWSGSAAWASVIHVFAKTFDVKGNAIGITGFAVERDLDGLTIGEEALTMGMRGTCQSRVLLDHVTVSADAVLGKPGQGFDVAQDAMKLGRLVITAAATGGMKRSAQLMHRYAGRRQVGTGLLLENPTTLQRFQDARHSITAIENLVTHVGKLLDEQVEVPIELYASCKITGPEYFWEMADNLVQMLGGRGYTENNIAPQLLRDARILRIFEGPTETLSMFLGARAHKSFAEYQQFMTQHFNAQKLTEHLQQMLRQLADDVRASSAFKRPIDAERWLHERSGQIVALTTLQGPQLPEQTHQWLATQISQILSKAQQFLKLGLHTDATDTAQFVSQYASDIGDLEQRAVGEEIALDPWLQRDLQATPQNESPLKQQHLSSNADRAVANSSSHNLGYQDRVKAVNVWMQNWIASRLSLPITDVALHEEFATFGLDSVDAAEMTNDLSTEFGLDIKPDMAWVYSNIEATSAYLASRLTPETEQTIQVSPEVPELDVPTLTQTESPTADEKWLEGEI